MTVTKAQEKHGYSLAEQRLYPHFKLTRERYPRLLATRKIEDDNAEYFGAFLPETGVRFWMDLLNKLFRLRSCEIAVDGSFPVPCPQFYRKRCLAPCVASLCDESTYAAQVALVRQFFQRDHAGLEAALTNKITALADELNFEAAKELRDQWLTIEKLLTDKDWNFWLHDDIDTFVVEEEADLFFVHLVTMRGRKTLGKRIFAWKKAGALEDVLPTILPQFYRLHAPKEIRVSHDFPGRLMLSDELSLRFQRRIKITVINEAAPKVFTDRALERAKFEREWRRLKRARSWPQVQAELQTEFALPNRPRRIEAFDVAHISGSDFVTAKVLWQDGQRVPQAAEYWFSDGAAELETLRDVIATRFANTENHWPDLVLIDGGKAHLHAALQGVTQLTARPFPIIAAVKPPQMHGAIARFVTEAPEDIPFDADKPSHHLLQTLRDEAHALANTMHRHRREHAHYYELAQVLPSLTERERLDLLKQIGSLKQMLALPAAELTKSLPTKLARKVQSDLRQYRKDPGARVEPFIVPLRFVAEQGEADDLRPLTTYQI
jgi:excinuclease ABC subunit C